MYGAFHFLLKNKRYKNKNFLKEIKIWEKKRASLHLALGICFQTPLLSKHVYKNGAKDIALTHQETLFLPANGSKHWSATNSSSECYSCLAVWQHLIDIFVMSQESEQISLQGSAPPHTLHEGVVVHLVATPLSWDPRVTSSYLLTVWPSCPHGILVCQIIGGCPGRLIL